MIDICERCEYTENLVPVDHTIYRRVCHVCARELAKISYANEPEINPDR